MSFKSWALIQTFPKFVQFFLAHSSADKPKRFCAGYVNILSSPEWTCAHCGTHSLAASSELPAIFKEVIRLAGGKWCVWETGNEDFLFCWNLIYTLVISSLLRFLLSFAALSVLSLQCTPFESWLADRNGLTP